LLLKQYILKDIEDIVILKKKKTVLISTPESGSKWNVIHSPTSFKF